MGKMAVKLMALILMIAMMLPLLLTSCNLFKDSPVPSVSESETEDVLEEKNEVPEEKKQ